MEVSICQTEIAVWNRVKSSSLNSQDFKVSQPSSLIAKMKTLKSEDIAVIFLICFTQQTDSQFLWMNTRIQLVHFRGAIIPVCDQINWLSAFFWQKERSPTV